MGDSIITLNDVGKRFNFDWIFRNIQYTFLSNQSYSITGANGSGKSTLLQMIAGCIFSSAGTIEIKLNQQLIEPVELFRHLSFSAPYLDLPEELTGPEIISFQKIFKPFIKKISTDEVFEISGLNASRNKAVRYFSTGMKQRLKIALAVLSDVPIVLLDEPTTNLDQSAVDWYLQLIQQYSLNRLFIIASNQERDYSFCSQNLNLVIYK